MRTPVQQLRAILKDEDSWVRFMRMATALDNSTILSDYLKEIQTLHSTRSLRVLGVQQLPSGKRLAEASLKDQAVRSRCVEIAMDTAIKRNRLYRLTETITGYISVNFTEELNDIGFKTIADKKSAISSLLTKWYTLIDNMDTVTEVADMVIKDIDQGSWALNKVISSLEIATKREQT